MKYTVLGFITLAATASFGAAQDVPVYHTLPKYQTPVPYSDQRNWHVTHNLGPTGARVWLYGHRGDSLESRELMVKSVEPGSPADGILRPYDFIIGAAVPPDTAPIEWESEPEVQPFESDARLAMARAITWAESDRGQGKLKILRNRDGKTKTVIVKLPVMGTYSETAPFSCPKTERITRNAAEFLADNMPPEGFFDLNGALNAMFLFAMDDARYLDHVRRTACRMSINHTISDAGHETWRWGYQNMFLAEYYLATGDKRVLPTIAEYCDRLAKGQCNPGTWGHKVVPDSIPPGYGSMNQSGLICFISMILGRQCGVPVDEEALAKSIGFYGGYAGLGGIPYGDHPPHAHPTCNGKNGSAAVAFNALDADPAAQWFARMCASATDKEVEEGHTGNFFSQTWSPIGAGLSGRDNVIRFWSRYNSYRDLARRWDGSFITQPLPHRREGDLSMNNYVKRGGIWTTGGFALGYLVDTKRLAILGRKKSVFGNDVPAKLKPALKLYHAKDFDACVEAVSKLDESRNEEIRRLARQLQQIAKKNIKSIQLTLADMKENLRKGDLYTVKAQLQAIEAVVDPEDVRLKDFRDAVDNPDNEEILATGKLYHQKAAGRFSRVGPWGFGIYGHQAQHVRKSYEELNRIADGDIPGYSRMARTLLEKRPFIQVGPNVSLLSTPHSAKDPAGESEKDMQAWRLFPGGGKPGANWEKPGFDDKNWQEVELPSKAIAGDKTKYLRTAFELANPDTVENLWLESSIKGNLKIYLNGTLIMDSKLNSWPRNWQILLKPATKELLQPGQNHLAVAVNHSAAKGDFQMDLTRKLHEKLDSAP